MWQPSKMCLAGPEGMSLVLLLGSVPCMEQLLFISCIQEGSVNLDKMTVAQLKRWLADNGHDDKAFELALSKLA